MCDYLLQLYVGLDFLSGNNICQSNGVKLLTADSRLFGDPVDPSFTFSLTTLEPPSIPINFSITQAVVCKFFIL